jgi:hypothetical protein
MRPPFRQRRGLSSTGQWPATDWLISLFQWIAGDPGQHNDSWSQGPQDSWKCTTVWRLWEPLCPKLTKLARSPSQETIIQLLCHSILQPPDRIISPVAKKIQCCEMWSVRHIDSFYPVGLTYLLTILGRFLLLLPTTDFPVWFVFSFRQYLYTT